MSHYTPDTPPTRGRLARLRVLAAPLLRVRRWFAHQPRTVRLGLVAVLAAAAVVGAVYAKHHRKKRADATAVAAAWREYEEAARKVDLDGMRTALDGVAAASPSDPTPPRYRAMLDRGEADPDSPEVALVLLAHHIAGDRLPEAAREAGKVLARYPKNWLAHCAQAHHALQVERNPARAADLLGQLPDPEDPAAALRPDGVLYALRLSELVGRDTAGLRRLILRHLVLLTRSPAAANAPPGAKVQLVSCYLEPFADPKRLTELAQFWAPADRLAEDAVNGAADAGDVPTLVRMAELGPRTRAALAALRDNDPNLLPPERFAPLLKAVDDRTAKAWQAVREKAPGRPESYRGLALAALYRNDPGGAVRQLLDGIAACGDRPELLEPLVAVVARRGTDDTVRDWAAEVWKSAEAAKTDPTKWCLAAELALALNRADAALVACRNARAAQPNHPGACATEARLLARAGKFLDAREALGPLGEAAVLTNPVLTRLHARILVGTGLWVLRDDEFKKVLNAPANAKTSLPAVHFLVGMLDAPPDSERSAWVAAQAELLLASRPDAPLATRVRAEALYRLADLSVARNPKGPALPPLWNADRVAAALRAFGQLPLDERTEPDAIAAVATLLLKGQGNAPAALRAASSFLASEATLTPRQLETLGAVLTANDRPADAVRVLERARLLSVPEPTAGCLVALAAAYRKNRQPVEARAALAAAERAPDRSDREQAELIAAKLALQQESP